MFNKLKKVGIKSILKFSYLRKITKIVIDIYLELDALEKMFVRLACRLGLVISRHFLLLASFIQNISKVNNSGLYLSKVFRNNSLHFN